MPTSSDRTPRRLRLRSQQRGAAGVFLVISLLLLVPILALALNIGQLYYAQRDLEKQATLAALSATQVASGCANDGRPGLLAAVTQEVIRIIAANNAGNAAGVAALLTSGINGSPGVEVGRIDVVGGLRRFVPLVDVDWFEADGNYILVHAAGEKYRTRGTITAIESALDPRQFVRIHRRIVVNMDRVREMSPLPGGDGLLMLGDGSTLRLSRTYRSRVR